MPKNKEDPVIIFYHYNTVEEPYSDWWENYEKDLFYKVIESYNIICIINGHIHSTYNKKWNGITVLNGGGTRLLRMNMEDNKLINIKII